MAKGANRMATRIVHESYIEVLGTIWLPYGAHATYVYRLSNYDIDNIGEITRENVEQWLNTHAGDFERVIDFRADIYDYRINEDIEVGWADPEYELEYSDITYGPGEGD
jgi:hypothetical protein